MLWYHLNTLSWSVNDHVDISLNKLMNNTLNLCPLTPHIMPSYTHKMAIVSWPQITWRNFTLCIRHRSTGNWIRYADRVYSKSVKQGSQTHLSMWAAVEDNSQSAGRTTKCSCFTQHCSQCSWKLKSNTCTDSLLTRERESTVDVSK